MFEKRKKYNIPAQVNYYNAPIVHCILYNRELYPAGVFEKRKKDNIPAQVNYINIPMQYSQTCVKRP